MSFARTIPSRPYVMAAALLGAHGLPCPPASKLRERRPAMPADTRYALLTDPDALPHVFPHLDALARHINRERAGAAIDIGAKLEELVLKGEDAPRRFVKVFILDLDGRPVRLLGHAYVDGKEYSREILMAAIEATSPPRFERVH